MDHHYARLVQLTRDGDKVAAAELQRTARRRGDWDSLAAALTCLGDQDELLREATLAWDTPQWEVLELWTRVLGIALRWEVAAKLDALILAANDRILLHRVRHDHVLIALREAARSAKSNDLGYYEIQTSSRRQTANQVLVLVVVRPDQTVTVGIAPLPVEDGDALHTIWPQFFSRWYDYEDSDGYFGDLDHWSQTIQAANCVRFSPSEQSPPDDPTPDPAQAVAAARRIAQESWLSSLSQANRSADWPLVCLLFQHAVDTQIDPKVIQRRWKTAYRGSADDRWLRDALFFGDKASIHWRATRELYIRSTTPQHLAQSCQSMRNIERIHFSEPTLLSAAPLALVAQVVACWDRSPDLPSLHTLVIQKGRIHPDHAALLWGDPGASRIKHLSLAGVSAPPQMSWPALRRPLESLTLQDWPPNATEEALVWLHSAQPKPPNLRIDWHSTPTLAAQGDTCCLDGVIDLTLSQDNRFSTIKKPLGVQAVIQRLDAPALRSLTLNKFYLDEPLIEALSGLGARIAKARPDQPNPALNLSIPGPDGYQTRRVYAAHIQRNSLPALRPHMQQIRALLSPYWTFPEAPPRPETKRKPKPQAAQEPPQG